MIEKPRDGLGHGPLKEKYEIVLETITDGFWIIDKDGNFLDVNSAYCRMTGYDLAELLKMKIADIEAIEGPEEIKKRIQKIKEVGYDRFETKHRCKDNKILDVEVTVNYAAVEGGMLFVFIRDITGWKKTEASLRDSQLKVRAVFDQTFQFIGLMTTDGILIEANKAALEFAGVEIMSVLNRPFWETPWWTHSSQLQQKLRESIKKAAAGEFVRFEATHLAKDGALRYIDFSLKPVKDESGKVVFMIPEGRDITERKKLEEALKESYAELELRVKVRTAELSKANTELQKEISQRRRIEGELKERMRDLEKFSKFSVDRELKMEELESKIKELEKKLKAG